MIPPHTECVATLPCEIIYVRKLAAVSNRCYD